MFFLIISSNKAFAQNTEKKPLVDFLISLEKKFDVVFTYADEHVRDIYITIPDKNLSLDKYLEELEKQTNLQFKKLNSRYIAIEKKTNKTEVSGTVVDKKTRETLVGVYVYSGNNATVSNEKGFFSIILNPEKDSVLNIRYTGYKQLKIKEYDLADKDSLYELVPEIISIEEVVINYIVKGIDKLTEGSILLNVRNLEVLPGLSEPDVLKTVQILPGVQSVNETVSDINMRGGTNDQNLYLWDGIRMYQTGHFFGLISAFNSHLIHKTKIIKNGTSVSFPQAVSGIIDMKLQDFPVNKFALDIGSNMISSDIIAKIPLGKKLSVIAGARSSINSLFITPTYKSYYKRAFKHTAVLQNNSTDTVNNYQDFSFYDLSFKLLYDISQKDKVRLSLLDIKNSIEFTENATIRDTLYSKNSSLDQSSILAGINYTRKWNEKNSTQVSAYISNYRLDGSNADIQKEQVHIQKNKVIDWGINLNLKSKLNQRISLLNGYRFSEIGIRNFDNISKPNYSRDVKDVLRIHALYTEAKIIEPIKKMYIRFGLRANYLQKFSQFIVEPRGLINYRLNKDISFELLAEKKSQYTEQVVDLQTDFLGVEKRRWVLSNGNSIPVIKSQQVSLGVNYKRNNFLFSSEAYYKKVDGIISPSQGFQNQYQYAYSIGEYTARGIEFLINKRFKKANVWANYTFAENDYYFPEFIPTVFPNNLDIRHSVSIGSTYNFKSIEVSSGFNFRTGKPYTKPSQENPNTGNKIIYELPNSSRLENYIRLDISAKYKFKIKKMKGIFGISIWNILNRKNIINIYFQRNEQQKTEQIIQYALGITPNIHLRLRF